MNVGLNAFGLRVAEMLGVDTLVAPLEIYLHISFHVKKSISGIRW